MSSITSDLLNYLISNDAFSLLDTGDCPPTPDILVS